jgi:hypothetical protein
MQRISDTIAVIVVTLALAQCSQNIRTVASYE